MRSDLKEMATAHPCTDCQGNALLVHILISEVRFSRSKAAELTAYR